jgi:hypothetical protein
MDTTAGNVQQGAAGRAAGTLRDPAAQAQALAAAQATRAPVESLLNPQFMEGLQELRRTGPFYVIFEREAAEARRTGRMSDKGINALWELAPDVARRLLGSTGMSRSQQQQAARYLPGQPAPVRIRSVAGVMAAVELANLAGPIVQQVRTSRFDDNVRPALEDILWWQDQGVIPAMEAVDDNLWPWSNEWTDDPKRIQELLNDKEVSYLTLTGIPEHNWDRFTVWASAKLKNYRDWARHIQDTKAIRVSGGQYMGQQTFEYRTSRVHGTSTGHDTEVIWSRNDRLDRILQAAARDVVINSNEQIGKAETEPGSRYTSAAVSPIGSTAAIFDSLPQASGKVTFRPDADPVLYTLHGQRERTGYGHESVFYLFPDFAAWDVPDGYVLVGGADFDTYSKVYMTKNVIKVELGGPYGGHLARNLQPNSAEVLLARKSDLVPVR